MTKCALLSLSIASGMLTAPTSHAAYFDLTTTIHAVGSADPTLWGEFDYVLLDNVASAGNCAVDPNSGKVLIVLTTPKQFAMALAAKLSGSQIRASLDDTRIDTHGNCKLRWMQVLQ
jgi:hypothetical protein